MSDYLNTCKDSIIANSIKPIRVSKSSIIERDASKKDIVIKTAAEELLKDTSKYLIPNDEKIEVTEENSIEYNQNEGYYNEKEEIPEMSVVR